MQGSCGENEGHKHSGQGAVGGVRDNAGLVNKDGGGRVKEVTWQDLTDIGHVLANVAQKHKGITKYREAIMIMQGSIDKDMDIIWGILNKNGSNFRKIGGKNAEQTP